MKMKWSLLIAATVLSISVLSACGTDSKQASQSSTTATPTTTKTVSSTKKSADPQAASTAAAGKSNPASTSAASATAGKLVQVKVNAKDFEFDKKVIHVKKGDKVKLTLHSNDGGHGLAIPAFNVNIQGNGSAEFTADKAGIYEYHCSVMCGSGHTNMTGKLIVE